MKNISPEKFERLLEGLGLEFMWANVIYDLFINLNSSFVEYEKEVNSSRVFWGITRDAIRDKAVLAVCRIYDQDERTNSLPNLLLAIRDNQELKKPIPASGDNPEKVLDTKQLERDIEFATKANEAVIRLIRWRSLTFVHRNAKRVIASKPLHKDSVPLYSDFDSLLKNGMKVFNRYAGHFKSTEYSTILPSGEDFTFVLDSVRENLRLRRKRMADELRTYGYDPKAHGLED